MARILIVDDDLSIREMLGEYLSEHGYEVALAEDGDGMRAALVERLPDLVLLDIRLPKEDGLSLARYLRERYTVSIIMVTAAGEVVDRIVGLEVGADDYISKPFDLRELLARVKSVLRRTHSAQPAVTQREEQPNRVAFGPCLLDLEAHRLFAGDGQEIPITAMEYDLLSIFAKRPNRVLSRDQILNLSQNRDWDPFDRSIDIRITRLRRKIEIDRGCPQVIKTVRGAGYMFVPQVAKDN